MAFSRSFASFLFIFFSILSLVSCQAGGVSGSDSAEGFQRAGFPTVTIIFTLVAAAIMMYVVGYENFLSFDGRYSFFVLLLVQTFFGFFFLFGYDSAVGASSRTATFGLVLLLQNLFGWYAMTENSVRSKNTFSVIAAVIFLAMIGWVQILTNSAPIWVLSGYQVSQDCEKFFGFSSNDSRCDDQGFIGFLRVVGLFSVFVQFLMNFLVFHMVNEENQEAKEKEALIAKKNAAAATAAASSAASTSSGGYNSLA